MGPGMGKGPHLQVRNREKQGNPGEKHGETGVDRSETGILGSRDDWSGVQGIHRGPGDLIEL